MSVLKSSGGMLAALSLLFLSGAGFAKSGKIAAADRQAERDKGNIVYPETPFDAALAKQMLGKGTVSIKGLVYNTVGYHGWVGYGTSGRQTPAGITVFLYPATSHLVEWEKNFAKQRKVQTGGSPLSQAINKGMLTKVYKFDDAMINYRYAAKSDEYGRFAFHNMLPGRYYLFSETTISGSYMGSEVIGSTTATNGYGQVVYKRDETRPQEYSWESLISAGKFIEIKPGKSRVEVEFKMHPLWRRSL
jgi:hypothetical protein